MKKIRFPHQIQAAAFGVSKGSGGYFMKPRTGKTLSVLDAATQLGCQNILIICPLSVAATWYDTLIEEGYDPSEIVLIHHRNKKIKQIKNRLTSPKGRFFIINYEKVRECDALHIRNRLLKGVSIPDWDCVIVDESKRISNHESKITDYLIRYPKPEYQHRFALSGTPAPESPREFASQFLFMEGEYFGYNMVDRYLAAYWDYDAKKYIWMMKDSSHNEEIREYIQARSFCLTMEDIGLGCEFFTSRHYIEPNSQQNLWLRWVRSTNTYVNKKGETKPLLPPIRLLFERMISCGMNPYTKEMISNDKIYEILDMYRDKPEPLLVVSFFKTPVYKGYEIFTEAGIRCEKIIDIGDKKDIEIIRKQFQAGEVDVIFAQIGIVKEGLDFSRLKKLIRLSNTLSQNDTEQVGQRGQNINRKDPYDIIELITQGTSEKRLSHLLATKEKKSEYFIKRELINEILQKGYEK